jgi:hypothetical protein
MKLFKTGSTWFCKYRGQYGMGKTVQHAFMHAVTLVHGTPLALYHLTNGSKA